MVGADELRRAGEAVRDETAASGQSVSLGVALRDGEQAGEPPPAPTSTAADAYAQSSAPASAP